MQIDDRLRSKLWRMEHLYKIVDKRGNSIVFKLNNIQKRIFNECQIARDKKIPIRVNILKARQEGVTTYFCIDYLDEVIWNKNRTAAIIAHERESLERIFRKVRYAWETMPEALRPRASLENVRELMFPDANSSIYISLKIRSGTVQHLHVSEKAYIADPDELKSGSYQAAQFGDITNESTANGLNHFYKDWVSNTDVWTNMFFPWYEHGEYVRDDLRTGPYDKELKLLNITQQQINWYNYKYYELNEDIVQMRREYPSNDIEAFETANRGVFLNELMNYPDDLIPIQTIKEPNYTVNIYKEVDEKEQYRLGADASGGFVDGDYSCFYILNAKTRDICLEWHGHIAPDMYGKEIEKWGDKYNTSLAGVEVNNHGLAVINSIKDTYPELFQTMRTDRVTNETTEVLGWNTNSKTKDELIDLGREILRDKIVPGLPKELKRELRTFVRKEDGTIGAESSCYDDRVMAFLITLMMIKLNPFWEFTRKIRPFGAKYDERRNKRRVSI